MNEHDVVIIGGGAAGLSAALVLSRARRTVLVVDAGCPRNAPAAHLHGYLARDGMPPAELLAAGRKEVRGYGGVIADGTVVDVVPDGHGFTVLLTSGQRASARQVLVTTGLRDELPGIPGLGDRWARDVLHCPYCHGWEVRDRRLGVIGGDPGAVRYAQIVRQWSQDITYFTPPDTLTAVDRTQLLARGIGVVEGNIDSLVVDSLVVDSLVVDSLVVDSLVVDSLVTDTEDELRGLQMSDGAVIEIDALFVPPRFVPNSSVLVRLGCDFSNGGDTDGWVTVDGSGRTSVPGVWAAGNIVDPRAQLITAAGAGSAAAIAINSDLVGEDVRNAVRDLDHGFAALSTTYPHPRSHQESA